jgi:hypothetical protein
MSAPSDRDLMQDLAEGLAAFHADMHDHMEKLTIVTSGNIDGSF